MTIQKTTHYEDVEDEAHHLVVMGLKHISGNKKEFIKIKRTIALSVFQTLIYAPRIRYWIDLDADMLIHNKQNRDKLFYWISKVEEDGGTGETFTKDRIISTSTEDENLITGYKTVFKEPLYNFSHQNFKLLKQKLQNLI